MDSPDDRPGPYYVSAIDGTQVHLIAGPYATHRAALDDVQRACHIASDANGRAWFMSWGTVRIEGCTRVGVLNERGLI